MHKRTAVFMAYFLFLLCIVAPACSLLPQAQMTYDPNKSYAAFLVVDSDAGRASLESMKQHSLQENLEIGPIEYYTSGTSDFQPILAKLTASPQIKVVWIISDVLDVPQIKTAMTKITYKGDYRYAPIMNGIGIKIQQ